MEKRLQTIKKQFSTFQIIASKNFRDITNQRHHNLLIVFALFFLTYLTCAQVPDFSQKIRIPVWAELDAYPGLSEAQDISSGEFSFAIDRLHKTAPFLINGMVYGWNFKYTPYDKTRNVDEFFEITEIAKINQSETPILYTKPWIEDSRLYAWVEFERNDNMMWRLRTWKSIKTQKIQGHGKAKISLGFDGITEATTDAVKNAVRSHYREIIKNKPKEIQGRVIIRSTPKIGIISGQYVVELDFFLETIKIVKYTQF